MFSAFSMMTKLPILARGYSSVPVGFREVMVSQSTDIASNTALEDWVVRKGRKDRASLLLSLSNNKTSSSLRATLISNEMESKSEELESVVLSSLSPTLPLISLPDFESGREHLSASSLSYTVQLVLAPTSSKDEVFSTLTKIAHSFLEIGKDGRRVEPFERLSLVRPDDDWFPGIERIREELVMVFRLQEKARMMRDRKARREGRIMDSKAMGLQNSYGH